MNTTQRTAVVTEDASKPALESGAYGSARELSDAWRSASGWEVFGEEIMLVTRKGALKNSDVAGFAALLG